MTCGVSGWITPFYLYHVLNTCLFYVADKIDMTQILTSSTDRSREESSHYAKFTSFDGCVNMVDHVHLVESSCCQSSECGPYCVPSCAEEERIVSRSRVIVAPPHCKPGPVTTITNSKTCCGGETMHLNLYNKDVDATLIIHQRTSPKCTVSIQCSDEHCNRLPCCVSSHHLAHHLSRHSPVCLPRHVHVSTQCSPCDPCLPCFPSDPCLPVCEPCDPYTPCRACGTCSPWSSCSSTPSHHHALVQCSLSHCNFQCHSRSHHHMHCYDEPHLHDHHHSHHHLHHSHHSHHPHHPHHIDSHPDLRGCHSDCHPHAVHHVDCHSDCHSVGHADFCHPHCLSDCHSHHCQSQHCDCHCRSRVTRHVDCQTDLHCLTDCHPHQSHHNGCCNDHCWNADCHPLHPHHPHHAHPHHAHPLHADCFEDCRPSISRYHTHCAKLVDCCTQCSHSQVNCCRPSLRDCCVDCNLDCTNGLPSWCDLRHCTPLHCSTSGAHAHHYDTPVVHVTIPAHCDNFHHQPHHLHHHPQKRLIHRDCQC